MSEHDRTRPREPSTAESDAAPAEGEGPLASLVSRFGAAGAQRLITQRRLQLKRGESRSEPGPAALHSAADAGTRGPGSELPFRETIQKSFGRHDISGVRAHVDAGAQRAARSMGAEAFASGDRIGFAGAPDLHTAAHEAAHVVQQQGRVQLSGGVGAEGDEYERHADEVADHVVQGRSAERLLDRHGGVRNAAARSVQLRKLKSDKSYEKYSGKSKLELEQAVEGGEIDDQDVQNIEAIAQRAELPFPAAQPGMLNLEVASATESKDAPGKKSKDKAQKLPLLGGTKQSRKAADKLAASDEAAEAKEEEEEELAEHHRPDEQLASDEVETPKEESKDPPKGGKESGDGGKKPGRFARGVDAAKDFFKNLVGKGSGAYQKQKDFRQPKGMPADDKDIDRHSGARDDTLLSLDRHLHKDGRSPDQQEDLQRHIEEHLPALFLYQQAVAKVQELLHPDDAKEDEAEEGGGDGAPAPAAPAAKDGGEWDPFGDEPQAFGAESKDPVPMGAQPKPGQNPFDFLEQQKGGGDGEKPPVKTPFDEPYEVPPPKPGELNPFDQIELALARGGGHGPVEVKGDDQPVALPPGPHESKRAPKEEADPFAGPAGPVDGRGFDDPFFTKATPFDFNESNNKPKSGGTLAPSPDEAESKEKPKGPSAKDSDEQREKYKGLKTKAGVAKFARGLGTEGESGEEALAHSKDAAVHADVGEGGLGLALGGDLLSAASNAKRWQRGGDIAEDKERALSERASGAQDRDKAKKGMASTVASTGSHAGHVADMAQHTPGLGEVVAPVGLLAKGFKQHQLQQQRKELKEIITSLDAELGEAVEALKLARRSGEAPETLSQRIQHIIVLHGLLEQALKGAKSNKFEGAITGVQTAGAGAKVGLVVLVATTTVATGGVAAGVLAGATGSAALGGWAKKKHDKSQQKKAEDKGHASMAEDIEGARGDDEVAMEHMNQQAMGMFAQDPQLLADGILYLATEGGGDAMMAPALDLLGLNAGDLREATPEQQLDFRRKLVAAISSLREGKR